MRISSVAVRPRMSLARAVSCTPGSCTTTRSAPCCWMIGSATPSSLTRLRRIVMFCWTAPSWMRFCASGLRPPTSRKLAGAVLLAQRRGRETAARSRCGPWCARPRRGSARRRSAPVARDARVVDLLLAQQRADVGRRSGPRALSSAAFMSTCSRKWTPPRRSRPRYIGSAPIDASQRGEVGSRLSATMYSALSGCGLRLGQRVLGAELRFGVGEADADANSGRGKRRSA